MWLACFVIEYAIPRYVIVCGLRRSSCAASLLSANNTVLPAPSRRAIAVPMPRVVTMIAMMNPGASEGRRRKPLHQEIPVDAQFDPGGD